MKQFWIDYEYDWDLDWEVNHWDKNWSYTQCYYHDYTIYNNKGKIIDVGLCDEESQLLRLFK